MNIPFLTPFCKRRKIYRTRRMMRAYRILREEQRLGLFRKVKRELADTALASIPPNASRFFFGAGKEQAELITRQYVLLRNTGVRLNKVLLNSMGSGNSKIVYPMPAEFRLVLISNGFNISRWCSSIAWNWNVIILWCFGVVSILRHFYQGLRSSISGKTLPVNRHIFFAGLQKNNFPRPCKDGRSHDTVTWFANWKDLPKNISEFRHRIKGIDPLVVNDKTIVFSEHIIPPIKNIKNLARFFVWSIGAVIISAIDILRGRWWNAFLLAEAAQAAITSYTKPNQLAIEYLFENSDTVYRPLWTYEAEQKGSRITSYFYSIFEDFKLPTGYEPASPYFRAMNWPQYLVWDEYQEQLIKRNVGEHANTRIAGSIWLSSSPVELPEIPHNAIAVFDIPPIKSSVHFGFSTVAELGYGDAEVAVTFINDINTALSRFGGTIIHKRKRNVDHHLHKGYLALLAKLSARNKLVSIEPDTSPIRVIEKCAAVISMPFTSTAIIGRDLGKPSVFYDPTGVIQRDDRGAHGIPVIQGEAELAVWMEKIFNTSNK